MEEKSIWNRIKNFLNRIFGKNKKMLTEGENEIIEPKIVNTNFKENIKVEEDKEKIRLLKLQQDFEEDKITEEEMSEEDIEALHELYDEQIEELNESTEKYKQETIILMQKLKQANG